MSHPMLPQPNHDERAEQLFLRDLKGYIRSDLDPFRSGLSEILEARALESANRVDPDALRDELFSHEPFRAVVALQRSSQELLWEAMGECIDRQINDLNQKAVISKPKGSLVLNPTLEHPDYMAAWDTHLMPGGFGADEGEGNVRQGALMDLGGAVYMMGRNGRNGGLMNDGRGHSLVSHLYEFYPDLDVSKLAELGCGVGNTALSVASYFPDAEFTACDMGPSVLRYAHARAEHMGVPIHFRQANAEATGLEAGAFDLVFTSVVFHEVSYPAIVSIINEMHRLLRPGGVAINLDVAGRYEELTTWQRISGSLDMDYNNEIGWKASTTADYPSIYRDAGFSDVRVGYQPAATRAERGAKAFHEWGYKGVGAGWYLSSARKPSL